MARWSEIEAEAPELCARARSRLDAFTHKTIATLRADGSPRISGTELAFANGDAWIGSMKRAVKALDLRRDGRYAMHSASADPGEDGRGWEGDGKFAGVAEEIHDKATLASVYPPKQDEPARSLETMHLFRLDISELVWVGLNEERTKMVIESWHPGRGIARIER